MRAPAAALVALLAAVGWGGAPPLLAEPPATELFPGLVLRDLGRGEIPAAERFRVVGGTFRDQAEAVATLERWRAAGETAIASYRPGGYEISVAELPDRAAAAAVVERLRMAGIEGELEIVAYGADLLSATGPWAIWLLEADPRRVRVEVAHAHDAAFGLETTRDTARRHGAAAAVNGGFYVVRGPLAGDMTGLLVVDGELWSEPDRGRGAIGFDERDGLVDALFGRIALDARLFVDDHPPIAIDGFNRARGEGEVIVFTPAFHRTTLTSPPGLEIVVSGSVVTAVRADAGGSVIPSDGFVVSFDLAAVEHAAGLTEGATVRLESALSSSLGDADAAWSAVDDATSAGPLLLVDSQPVDDWSSESITRAFCEARHPRTAVGERADGTLLFLVVDGRQPEASVGMSCGELAALFLELGAVSAVNLDGGGSTTLVAGPRIVNNPSDSQGERANGDAVLLFPRSRGDSR